jgi:hypothetical protein
MSRPRQPWSGYAWQVLAALLLVFAWGRLCWGLLGLTPSHDPLVDLEAGGGFAATVLVYLPGLLLTIALAGVVLVALFPRPASAIALIAAAQVVVGFNVYFLIQDAKFSRYLTEYLPGLDACVWQSTTLAALSVVPAVASMILRFRQLEAFKHHIRTEGLQVTTALPATR